MNKGNHPFFTGCF